jgi:hypothetical protein
MTALARFILASILGVSCTTTPEPRSCAYGMSLDAVARDHRAAWSGAFDGRPLDDSELLALADAQALLDCLAGQAANATGFPR